MNHKVLGKVLFDPATGKMGEGIGHYHFEKLGNNEFKVTCENPYPCDFDKGLLKGASRNLKHLTRKWNSWKT
jgi:hypothetical protein